MKNGQYCIISSLFFPHYTDYSRPELYPYTACYFWSRVYLPMFPVFPNPTPLHHARIILKTKKARKEQKNKTQLFHHFIPLFQVWNKTIACEIKSQLFGLALKAFRFLWSNFINTSELCPEPGQFLTDWAVTLSYLCGPFSVTSFTCLEFTFSYISLTWVLLILQSPDEAIWGCSSQDRIGFSRFSYFSLH